MRTTLLKKLSTIVLAAGLALGALAQEQPAFVTTSVGNGDPGSLTDNPEPGSYTVIGGGNDIWSTADNFTFNYYPVTNDFDVRVRVESLEIAANWTKAGLMARETTNDNSRMVFVRVTPEAKDGIAGVNDVKLAMRTGTTAPTEPAAGVNVRGEFEYGAVPNGIMPGAWLRLQRTGNTFTGYYSPNGTTWTSLGTIDTATGSPGVRETWVDSTGAAAPANEVMLLGLAVSRHSGTKTTVRAEFRDYAETSNQVQISSQPLPQVVLDGNDASFSVAVAGGYDVINLQWMTNGVAVAGETNRNFTIRAKESMDGTIVTVSATSTVTGDVAVSDDALLSVSNPAPVITGISSRGNPNGFFVFFNEALDETSATTIANYQIDGGVTITGARMGANDRTVIVETSPLTLDTTYNVTVTGVTDASENQIAVDDTTRAFTHGQDIPARLSYNFDNGAVPPGTFVGGTAVVSGSGGVNNSGVLKITEAANDQAGTFVAPINPPPGVTVSDAQITFHLRVDSPQTNPADGIGVSLTGDVANRPGGAAYEEGVNYLGNGFYFTLDNWDSGGAEGPALDLHYNGTRVATRLIPKYNNPAFVPVTITLKDGGLADLNFDGTNVFSDVVLPNFQPIANAKLAIGARTGGANERHYVDNLEVRITENLGPVSIVASTQSTNSVQEKTQGPSFSVIPDGTPRYSFQWYSNGVLIAGANANSFQVGTVQNSNNGDVYSVVVNNEFSSITNDFTFEVVADVIPPELVDARATPNGTGIVLRFNEPMDPETATNEFAYVVSGDIGVISASLSGDGRSINLTTTQLAPGTSYNITATGLKDAQFNLTDPDPLVATVTSQAGTNGVWLIEFFNGIGGTIVSALTNTAAFLEGRASSNAWMAGSSFPQTSPDKNDYGVRITGYIIPAVSGSYDFQVHSDDSSVVMVSPNDNPAEARPVVREDGCCTARNGVDQGYAPIVMEAGKAYYIAALMKEGGGGDYIHIRWKNRNGAPSTYELIPSEQMAYFVNPDVTVINFSTQPQSATVEQNKTNTFTAVVSSSTQITPVNPRGTFTPALQWQVSTDGGTTWTNIEGATRPTLSFVATPDQTGNQYRLVGTTVGVEAISDVATLTVETDITPPSIVKASLINGTNVYVIFNEVLANDPESADDNVEEEFAWGLSLDGGDIFLPAVATVMSNGVIVKLELPMENAVTAGDLTVTLAGHTDLAGNSNFDGQTVPVFVWDDSVVGLGNGVGSEVAIPLSDDDISITAGGGDTWGTSDNGTFVYEMRTGDFDIALNLANFAQWAHTVAKAGPMVRETTNANSINLYLNNNPPTTAGGRGLTEAGRRTTTGGDTAGWQNRAPNGNTSEPAWQIPNSWLRLRRVGDQFIGYRSTNGTDWVMMAEVVQNYPDTVPVGIEVTAQTGLATIIVSNYTDVTYPEAAITITQDLDANVEVNAGSNGTAQVAYTITGAPANEAVVQWYFNGNVVANNIINTGSSNTFTSGALNVPEHDNGQLYAVITVSGLSVTSAVSTVDVVPSETDAPVITTVTGEIDGTNIVVTFNERITTGTATNLANFTVSGRTVTAISFNNNNEVTLILDTALTGGSYTVSATGITDFLNGNTGDSQGVLDLGPVVGPELTGMTKTGDTFSLSFQTEAGVTYTVQTTDDLGEEWTDLGTVTGDGTIQSFEDTEATAEQRFYRVVIGTPAG